MHKVIVFDLDGTLAPVGKGLPLCDFEKLKRLEKMGYQMVICSGKGVDYLCGFARQLELEHPIIVGENGAIIQIGAIYPPEQIVYLSYSDKAKQQIVNLKAKLEEALGEELYYQANEVVLNPFPRKPETFDKLVKVVEDNAEQTTELKIMRHVDCLDILPKDINKYNGLAKLAEILELSADDFIAVGDGPNDVAMLQFADIGIGVGASVKEIADYFFDGITPALDFLLEQQL